MSDCASTVGVVPAHPIRADLHTHSNASDGVHAPADLLQQASRRGLSVVALTDHDTTHGLSQAADMARELGIIFVPGIELSTDVGRGEIHVLGYGISPDAGRLQETLERLRSSRVTRAEGILDRLRKLGIDVPFDAIAPVEAGASIGRPHIARALVTHGHAASVRDAFDRYLGQGKPAYVASERLTPVDAVRLIRAASGIPVVAHPFSSPEFPHSLPPLIAAGLVGLEVYYGEYDEDSRRVLADIASRHGLIATGGSDYHGPGFKEGRELGSVDIPSVALSRFLEVVAAATRQADDRSSW